MPHRELIHSESDVASALLYALDSGFQIRTDDAQPKPKPCILNRKQAAVSKSGVFYLFRPEWVYGEFQIMPISGGTNRGKYIVSPSVNHSPIVLYFSGERNATKRRRFGAGLLSFNREWLELPAKVIRRTPPEVELWFKKIFKHLSSGIAIKTGKHNYYICRGVMADHSREEALPPFDFIPWKLSLNR